jgi:hypothetical protein
VKWCVVWWCGVNYVIYVMWFCFEVKWIMVKFMGIKVPCTLRWLCTEVTWLYCDYIIWCVLCTLVVITYFVMCGWVYQYVGVFWKFCGCFGNMCIIIYCAFYCLYSVFELFRLCIFIHICFVCTSVKTTVTK